MKFYNEPFRVNKDYSKKLLHRLNVLRENLPKRKMVHLTLITTDGICKNEYSGLFQKVITLEQLLTSPVR